MTTIKVRRGVASLWTSRNPTLAEGEIGLETDTVQIKFGDGSTPWSSLPYFLAADLGALEDSIAALSDSLVAAADATAVTLTEITEEAAETADTQDSMLIDLTRKFRLLLKAWLVVGLPAPAGLEDEIGVALATE